MTEKLTSYDPVADLASDEAIAIFMAEAFQTNNAASKLRLAECILG